MAGISESGFNAVGSEDDCHLLWRNDLRIEPFQPVIYNIERVGALESVIAPPYDVMTPQERERYASSHPFNIVRILLPRQACENIERSNDEYELAGALTRQWLSEGILVVSQKPFVFPYRQLFRDGAGRAVEQWAVIVALQLREYSTGVVRPHEMTTQSSKLDRLMLLRATGLEMGQVQALFVDNGSGVVDELLQSSARHGEPWLSVTDDKGVSHTIWRVDDGVWLSELRSALRGSWVLIADGHHRYETAIAYMRERWLKEGGLSDDHPACYIGVALANLHGKVTILPTHRLLRFSTPHDRNRFVKWLSNAFGWSGCVERMGAQEALERFHQMDDEPVSFVVLYGDEALLMRLPAHELSKLCCGEADNRASLISAGVNTVVLHELLLPMAMRSIELNGEPSLSYTQDVTEAVMAALSDERMVAILLRPITTSQLRLAAELGERLPPKSTYFYPKVPSGLIMRLLNKAR